MTTEDFIIDLFCQIEDQMKALTTYQFAANPGITAFQQILYTGKSNT